jgi:transposase-like protein
LAGKQRLGESQPWLSQLIRLSTEKTLQEILEAEQGEYLGRARYQRTEAEPVYRNGYEPGTLKTAEGVLRVEKPQLRGTGQPYRSQLWERFQSSSEQLRRLVVEMYVLGMSQRDIEQALEKSLGEFLLSRHSVSQIARDLTEEYEAFKQRDLSGFEVAYLFIDTVYEPLRQYGAQTGVTCCWAILCNGSKVLLDLTVSNTESYPASLEFLRGMVKRGLPVPLSITTDRRGSGIDQSGRESLAEEPADPLLVSQDAKPAAEGARSGVEGIESRAGRCAGCSQFRESPATIARIHPAL